MSSLLQSLNPHDQSVVGELPVSSAADVAAIVSLVRAAFPAWRRLPIEERIDFIKKFRDKTSFPAVSAAGTLEESLKTLGCQLYYDA